MVLVFVTVTSLMGSSIVRGLSSLFLGLAIGLVGIDQLTGQPRLAFGVPQLFEGLPVVALAVGLFAVAEAVATALAGRRAGA